MNEALLAAKDESQASPESVALRAIDIRRSFHDGQRELEILRGVDLELHPGEAVAVLGRSGTGKSTLLQILGLLDRPSAGELWVGGRRSDGLSERERTRLRGRTLGFVFQQYHLVAELTALENVALGLAVGGGGFLRSATDRARRLLERVGLGDRAGHKPPKLSGGERQRVAIARALAGDPVVLLADEPTGSLDPHTGGEVLDLFWAVVRERNMAMILVTHDEAVAERADRTLVLKEGRLHPR